MSLTTSQPHSRDSSAEEESWHNTHAHEGEGGQCCRAFVALHASSPGTTGRPPSSSCPSRPVSLQRTAAGPSCSRAPSPSPGNPGRLYGGVVGGASGALGRSSLSRLRQDEMFRQSQKVWNQEPALLLIIHMAQGGCHGPCRPHLCRRSSLRAYGCSLLWLFGGPLPLPPCAPAP